MTRRPRILYLTRHCPGGRAYGAQLRALHIGKLLQRIGDVTLVIASGVEWSESELEATRKLFEVVHAIHLQPTPISGPWQRLRYELDPRFLNTDRMGSAPQDSEAVRRLLGEHDLAWLHGLILPNLLRIERWGRSVLDFDDLLSRYHAELVRRSSGLERLKALRLRRMWRRREALTFERFSVATVCSEEDRACFPGDPRVHVVRNGFEAPALHAPRKSGFQRLGLVGLMEYRPNAQGLRWFLSRVWPALRARVPGAELRVVGQGSDAPGAPAASGVTGLGWVADLGEEMATWSGSIIPIQEGAGTRIKILEAFARGVPVVSTSLGAFGYPVQSGRELLLADDPAAFGAACERLLREPRLGAGLATRGRELFDSGYSWDSIGPAVAQTVLACLEAGPAAPPRSPGLRPPRALR